MKVKALGFKVPTLFENKQGAQKERFAVNPECPK